MFAMYVLDIALRGRPSTRVFHALSAGKTWQPPMLGTAPLPPELPLELPLPLPLELPLLLPLELPLPLPLVLPLSLPAPPASCL
jgi:hypothetical protein